MRFVPAIFPLFLIFSLIGCSSDKVPLVEKTCAEQQMRCSNDMIQKCHLAQWVDWTDCHAQELRCILVDAIPTCGHGSVMESDSGSLGDTEVPGIGDSNSDSMTFPDSASTDSSQYSGDDTDSGSSEPVDTDDTSPKGSDSADTTSVSDDDTGTDGDTGTVIDDSSTNGDTSYASSTDSDSETADSETQDSETADSETQDSETADSET
ncbi:MAG: hypothetical protein JXR76_10805, partial [Deltaproteobacteria bacterium]|nr:hypothetical protein [Deltaproteobacteria bacterium]